MATVLTSRPHEKILLFKIVMQHLKPFLSLHKDSKLHYNAILNIGLAVDMVQTTTNAQQATGLAFTFMAQEVNEGFEVPEKVK